MKTKEILSINGHRGTAEPAVLDLIVGSSGEGQRELDIEPGPESNRAHLIPVFDDRLTPEPTMSAATIKNGDKCMAIRYPGGKGGAGVHQTIINLIPAHRVYIEPFVGGGNIFARKRPAQQSIIIDADSRVFEHWNKVKPKNTRVMCGDAISILKNYVWKGDELVYCDPPYVMAVRSGGKQYRHEFTDQQHHDLLDVLLTIPAAVMLSGYRNAIYDDRIPHRWCRVDFQAMTRGGVRTESLWMNFQLPAIPAELTYLGADYRERERIKRKKTRWAAKFAKLPVAERAAIMEALLELGQS